MRAKEELALLNSCRVLGCIRTMPWSYVEGEFKGDKLGFLVEEISKRNGEEMEWLLLTTYADIKEQKDALRAEFIIKDGIKL